jgi:hypothetical protein
MVIYKFASREGYLAKLIEFNANQNIIDFANSLDEKYLGIVVGAVAKGKSLLEIVDLVNKKKIVDKLKEKTQKSTEEVLPSDLENSVKSWAIIQLKKFPIKKNLILSSLNRINQSVIDYNINLSSYDFDDLIKYINQIENENSEFSMDYQIDSYFKKLYEFALQKFRTIDNTKLIN